MKKEKLQSHQLHMNTHLIELPRIYNVLIELKRGENAYIQYLF